MALTAPTRLLFSYGLNGLLFPIDDFFFKARVSSSSSMNATNAIPDTEVTPEKNATPAVDHPDSRLDKGPTHAHDHRDSIVSVNSHTSSPDLKQAASSDASNGFKQHIYFNDLDI